MSLATVLKGAVADARPLQNSDFRRLWVTQIITMIGAQLSAARLEGQADTGQGHHRVRCRPPEPLIHRHRPPRPL